MLCVKTIVMERKYDRILQQQQQYFFEHDFLQYTIPEIPDDIQAFMAGKIPSSREENELSSEHISISKYFESFNIPQKQPVVFWDERSGDIICGRQNFMKKESEFAHVIRF